MGLAEARDGVPEFRVKGEARGLQHSARRPTDGGGAIAARAAAAILERDTGLLESPA